ncbi:hypothetical protein B7C62_19000 [Kitasatospora albolonga]|uniref:Uncharacterized protein n=1 Tax=Kitasatospora albolonga TaxID=68173 RepID=A0ABC8BV67_9ACTN|nr:hypothetical protein B7C62_19000 [Kitasatospora albolonga]
MVDRDRILRLCQGAVWLAMFFLCVHVLQSMWMVVLVSLAAGSISGILLPHLFHRKGSSGQGERSVGAQG